MRPRRLPARFTRAATVGALSLTLIAGGCSRDASRPRAASASVDTSLAHDLQLASDTSAYSEAADVSMADTESGAAHVPPVTMRVPSTPAPAPDRPEVASRSAPVATPAPVPAPAREGSSPAATPTATPSSAGPCASPAKDDQRRCLMSYLAQSDVQLDRNYQALIGRLRARAGTPAGAPDPAPVRQLRVSQRAWLVYRDTECRRRNRGQEGPLWAPMRARCLGEFSGQRAAELADAASRVSAR